MRAPINPPPTPLNVGDIITYTPRIIDERDGVEDTPDKTKVRLVVGRADYSRYGGAKRIDIIQSDDEPPVELYHQLAPTVIGFEIEDWGRPMV